MNRRVFLKSGGLAFVGLSTLPSFLTRAVAASAGDRKKILVVLFQRGAADGLNIVVPFAEPNYYKLRPSIAIPAPTQGGAAAALDLDGHFGLHPSLAPLKPLFQQGALGIVHAAGSPDTTRSHFDAQDYMESGTPGLKSTVDGWLNRGLRLQPEPESSPFRAVAMGASLPRVLQGSAPAVALPDLRQFQVIGAPQVTASGFEAIYSQTVDKKLGSTGRETFEAINLLKKADPAQYRPDNGAEYPRGRTGQQLQQVAQLIKSNVGLEVAFLDSGGWDTHVNQGNVQGQLSNLLRELGESLAAFHRDMGDRMNDIVLVTMSEFGRTAHENGSRGTDHGHANCMFLMGGAVNGGKVHGRWPGLEREQLNEGRDLALTTDFRTVLSEVMDRHLGVGKLAQVFPGFTAPKYVGVLKS